MNRKIRRTIIGALRDNVLNALSTHLLALNNFTAYMTMVEADHQSNIEEVYQSRLDAHLHSLRSAKEAMDGMEATIHRQQQDCRAVYTRLNEAHTKLHEASAKLTKHQFDHYRIELEAGRANAATKKLHDCRMQYAEMTHVSVKCYSDDKIIDYAMPVAVYNEIRDFAHNGRLILAIKALRAETELDLKSSKNTIEKMEWTTYKAANHNV